MTKCPVCKNDYVNIYEHWFNEINENNEEYISLLNDIVFFSNIELEYNYAFKVAEKIRSKWELDGIDISKLTDFVAYFTSVLGYSIRKRADLPRTKETKSISANSLKKYIKSVLAIQKAYYVRSIDAHIICDDCGTDKNVVGKFSFSNTEHKNLPLSCCKNICSDCFLKIKDQPSVAITRIFTFAAAHHLPYHKGLCQYTHGHEWKLEVSVKAPINKETGMVLDFSDLKKFVNENIIDILDHNYINDFIHNPTAENICYWTWRTLEIAGLKSIDRIKVWEAPNSIAEITLDDMYKKCLLGDA